MPRSASAARLRAARERAALSQAELARRARVSRALVSAIEHGRHVPAVDAALRLAAALGATAESLFADEAPIAPVAALGERLADGTLVRAGRVGDRVIVASLPSEGDGTAWATADGVINGGALRLFAEGSADGTVVVGCDPSLAVADEISARRRMERIVSVSATTGQALQALADGRCHGALVHGRADHLPEPPVPVVRWHLARWRVGVGFHPALGHPSLESLLAGKPQLVRRHATAASDQAVVRVARRLGLGAPARGPIASGHLEAALRASWAQGAAVTFEPAAATYGLRFAALETHDVQLWVPEAWRAHPGITTLREIVGSRAFRDRVTAHGGYDLADSGAVRAAA